MKVRPLPRATVTGGNGGSKGGGNGGRGDGGGNKGGKGGEKSKADGSKSKSSKAASNGARRTTGKGLKSLFQRKDPAKTRKQAASKTKGTARKVKTTRSQQTAKRKVAQSAKQSVSARAVKQSVRPPAMAKTRPVQASLKGLNSLNRNINGLMISSDPKMNGFRDFVRNSAALERAEGDLLSLEQQYAGLAATLGASLSGLSLEVPTTPEEFDALSGSLSALAQADGPVEGDYLNADGSLDQPAFDAAVAEHEASVASANAALADLDETRAGFDAVAAAGETVAELETATSQEAMVQAMVDGLNATGAGPVAPEDMTDDMIGWVSERLGVGDAQGLIDDYVENEERFTNDDEEVTIDPSETEEAPA